MFVNRFFTLLLIIVSGCSPKVTVTDPEDSKPAWLRSEPYQQGYYTGIGHSRKDASPNFIQAAKKSALEDLVSQIKVNVSGTSVLSQLEVDKKFFSEQYEQIIQTSAAEEIEEFELVDAWEDDSNYWVYYRLSISRYRQIKEEQRRNAVSLATDFYKRAKESEEKGQTLQALTFYFQAFRSIEKYLEDAIRISVDDRYVLLGNEIYGSIQRLLENIVISATPSEISVNRRIQQSNQTLTAKAQFKTDNRPVTGLPVIASFEKGNGDIFPKYTTNDAGEVRVLLNKIASRDIDQTLRVTVDTEALSGSAASPVFALVTKTLNAPQTKISLKVQRPLVYLTSEEKSLGLSKNHLVISNKLRNLLATNGFEFTNDKSVAELWFDVKADSEKGSVSGSIYVTYLTSVIKVVTAREGKEIYATTLDRIKGFGLDYEKSSIDAYNKAVDTLEKDKMGELLNMVLQ